jgi:D-alanyl-D-alanine carboxypeptidase/D-alanyl-D-alanine-endopeptidase (penicillin-binding protein 4)
MIKKLLSRMVVIWACSLLLISCSTEQKMTRKVTKVFKSSQILKKYHSGFALYDPSKGVMVYQQDADKYFTPASNTKLFTFYAGLKMLSDSIPTLRYIEKGDSLIFWGTGDPSNLQSELKNTRAYDFLKASGKRLFFAPGRYKGNFYGKGWQWDDYNDYYQAEIDELPLMDNLVDYRVKGGSLTISPKAFAQQTSTDYSSKATSFSITRSFTENKFSHPALSPEVTYNQKVPFKVSLSTTLQILSDTLSKRVDAIQMQMPANAKTLYGIKRDSVLKEMMLPSDNFIAEQLLLVYSDKLGQDLSTEKAIAYIQKEYLTVLPDKFIWADGSGLSRYDLVTPRSIIKLLDLIYKEVNDPKKLFSMLPAGGMSGTLKSAYPKTNQPFVFGKTGSLSNIHNQSGYVVTKKGKTYLFSFLNNNFVIPTADVRKEMVRIMTYIHENY